MANTHIGGKNQSVSSRSILINIEVVETLLTDISVALNTLRKEAHGFSQNVEGSIDALRDIQDSLNDTLEPLWVARQKETRHRRIKEELIAHGLAMQDVALEAREEDASNERIANAKAYAEMKEALQNYKETRG